MDAEVLAAPAVSVAADPAERADAADFLVAPVVPAALAAADPVVPAELVDFLALQEHPVESVALAALVERVAVHKTI